MYSRTNNKTDKNKQKGPLLKKNLQGEGRFFFKFAIKDQACLVSAHYDFSPQGGENTTVLPVTTITNVTTVYMLSVLYVYAALL